MRFRTAVMLLAFGLCSLPTRVNAAGWNAGENSVMGLDSAWSTYRTAMPGEIVSCRAVFRVEGGREYIARSAFSDGIELYAVSQPRQNGVPVNSSAYTVLTGNAVRDRAFEIHFSSIFSAAGPVTLEILYSVRLGDEAGEQNTCSVVLEGRGEHFPGEAAVIITYGFTVFRGIGIADPGKQINPLPGACYSLYRDAEMNDRIAFIQKRDGSYLACLGKSCHHAHHAYLLRTRETGTAVLNGLPEGTYYLQECRTPEGYSPMANGLEIVVSPSGEITAGGVPLPERKVELVERLAERSRGDSVRNDPLAFYIYGNRVLSVLLSIMVIFRKRLLA